MSKFQKPKQKHPNYIKYEEEQRIQNILPSIEDSSDYQESQINSTDKINKNLLESLLNKRKDQKDMDLRNSIYDIKSEKTKKLEEEDFFENPKNPEYSENPENPENPENYKNYEKLTEEEKKQKKDIIGGDIGSKVEMRKSKIDPTMFKKKKKTYPYKKNQETILQLVALKVVLNKLVVQNQNLSKDYINLRIRDNEYSNKIYDLENRYEDLIEDENLEKRIKEKNQDDLDGLEKMLKLMSENLDRVTGDNSQELFLKDVRMRGEEYLVMARENDENFGKLARNLNNFKGNLINVTSNN